MFVSDLRLKVYEAVLREMSTERAHFRFEALAVPRDAVDVAFFSDRRHLA